ncbi:MAG: hypothetical protein HZA06_00475 [Nitrospirae bacterium]|nr:hypothetical protein [Nitrospirota bacterium]
MTKENPKSNLFVISDLHLSAGFNEETKCYSREEDFFFDNEFKRFLEYLEKENPGKNHLIINGDMFDFLQVNGYYAKKLGEQGKVQLAKDEDYYGLGTEPDKTVFKLQRIRDGHKIFFEALRDFLSKGNELSIISGNHDIEFFWDKVREELINILSNNDNAIKSRIKFYLWFFYDNDNKIYIEHGNQYDRMNSFEIILNPVIPPMKDKILLPLGSFFVRYFFNKLEDVNPFADNIKPYSRYIIWSLRNQKLKSFEIIWKYSRTLIKSFLRSKGLKDKDRKELLNDAQPRIDAICKETGLSLDVIEGLRMKLSPPVTKGKFAFILNSTFILTIILFLLLLKFALLIKTIYGFSFWFLFSSLSALFFPLIKWIMSKFRKDYLLKAAREIKTKILKDVKIIVMGHTHDPLIKKAGYDCWYYNTSTWTTVFSDEERLIRDEKQFALLKIKLTDKGPDAQLMRWNDIKEECERLILFEEGKSIANNLPIVLVHGIGGFDEIKISRITIPYFKGIRKHLEEYGCTVFVPRLRSTASIKDRAEDLKNAILSFTDSKVHIIAHSMGGLDARYMISKLGMADKVATLVTIGTPHWGSEFADWGVKVLGEKLGLIWLLEKIFKINTAGFRDLMTESCKKFNDEIANVEGIKYISYVGVQKWYKINFILQIPYWYIRYKTGQNDGLVHAESAKWGDFRGMIDADHLNQIGWRIFPCEWPERFNTKEFYEGIARYIS